MKLLPPIFILCALAVCAAADGVRLTWKASPSTNVVAYRIYCGTNSRDYSIMLDAGLVQTQRVALPRRGRWFFAATAVDGDGVESSFSNEVQYEIKPVPPVMDGRTWVRLTPVFQRSTNLISWDLIAGEPTWLEATNAAEFFSVGRLVIEPAQVVANP